MSASMPMARLIQINGSNRDLRQYFCVFSERNIYRLIAFSRAAA
jgi:prophage antirepressor-like protein